MCTHLILPGEPRPPMEHFEFAPITRADRPCLAQWGLVHSWEGSSVDPVCTVDSRLAATRPRYRGALLGQRCLIPAVAFEAGGQWFTHPIGLMLAGLWDRRGDLDSFAIITTQGPGKHQRIREFPLLVWPEDEALYLAKDFDVGSFSEISWRAHTNAEAKAVTVS